MAIFWLKFRINSESVPNPTFFRIDLALILTVPPLLTPKPNRGQNQSPPTFRRSLSIVFRSRPLSISSGNGEAGTISSPTPPFSPPSSVTAAAVAGYRVELSPSGGVVHNRVSAKKSGGKFATSSPTLGVARCDQLLPVVTRSCFLYCKISKHVLGHISCLEAGPWTKIGQNDRNVKGVHQ